MSPSIANSPSRPNFIASPIVTPSTKHVKIDCGESPVPGSLPCRGWTALHGYHGETTQFRTVFKRLLFELKPYATDCDCTLEKVSGEKAGFLAKDPVNHPEWIRSANQNGARIRSTDMCTCILRMYI